MPVTLSGPSSLHPPSASPMRQARSSKAMAAALRGPRRADTRGRCVCCACASRLLMRETYPSRAASGNLHTRDAEQLLAEQHERIVADGTLAVDLDEGPVGAAQIAQEGAVV